MVNGFLDTSILVDVIRLRVNAIQWFHAQQDLGIMPLVQMELVAGAGNKIEQQKALGLVAKLAMIYPTQADIDWAMHQQTVYALSHNAGMNDCLIASVSYRLQIPLYTNNLKHFTPLLGGLAQKPY